MEKVAITSEVQEFVAKNPENIVAKIEKGSEDALKTATALEKIFGNITKTATDKRVQAVSVGAGAGAAVGGSAGAIIQGQGAAKEGFAAGRDAVIGLQPLTEPEKRISAILSTGTTKMVDVTPQQMKKIRDIAMNLARGKRGHCLTPAELKQDETFNEVYGR